ncbi:MAG: phosphoglucomutase/phosphomannomutase family protein [Candidatus Omnitrophota bacterium]|nr:phosphoglucomutase/phosphomannomutase family protein [Candidatus Omnitrophota bacterium]
MHPNKTIKFGTDGWRGVIGDNFTFDNVRRVAQAIADYYNEATKPHLPAGVAGNSEKMKIAVGYDTRFQSDQFAAVVSEVLINNGIDVVLSDKAIPTPALSFATKNKNLTAGVMITASHNPSEYNGIKIKTSSGGAATLEITEEVEKRILPQYSKPQGNIVGSLTKEDLTKDYIKFLRSYIDLARLKKANFRVLVDAMFGSGNSFIAEVLKGSSIKLEFIRNEINPSFGGLRPEPVLENLGPSIEKMKKERFDLGLVLDGDADRIACFAKGGVFIHPQKILGLLILHLFQDRKMKGGVVKTIAGTALIDNIVSQLNLKLYETPVGFKYISDLMENKDILVGGEEAGGMGFKNYIPERDGSLAGLLLLEMMVYRKKDILHILNGMEKQFGRYYYLRLDLKLKRPISSGELLKFKEIGKVLNKEVVKVKDFDGIKLICQDASWLMLRASGTEPLVRVYAESKSLNRSKEIIKFGESLVGEYAL